MRVCACMHLFDLEGKAVLLITAFSEPLFLVKILLLFYLISSSLPNIPYRVYVQRVEMMKSSCIYDVPCIYV